MSTAQQPDEIASTWLSQFSKAISAGDVAGIVDTFLPIGWLRDVLTFTWDLRALEGQEKITAYLKDNQNLENAHITDLKLAIDEESGHYRPIYFPILGSASNASGVEAVFSYSTKVGVGRGCVRLVEVGGGVWKALVVCMMLTDLKGHEEAGFESGIYGGHTLAWTDVYAERKAKVESNPYVLIVGAGQTGLQIAARFKQMDIPTLVIERNERVGDNWRKRYPTLVLHTMKQHHQLLYQAFPSNWPYFTPRDKISDWLEQYSVSQDLVVWLKTEVKDRPVYNPETKRWDVTVHRDGRPIKLNPAHIVLATGTAGKPTMPDLPGKDTFQGEVLHTAAYQGGDHFSGKNVIVIGAGNSSIDICQDLSHHRANTVTMVQRSSTCVVTGDNTVKHLAEIWAPDVPVEVGDFKFATMPLGLARKTMQGIQDMQWEEEKELHEKLRKGGIKLNLGPDGQGQFLLVFERGGGYWLDKGGADLIASGEIKVKQGTEPVAFTKTGLSFSDGSEVQADAVIFATGYIKIRETNIALFGEEVINQTSEVYGLDAEGEISGSYRPSGYPGLWFGSGDFYCSRFMSKHLALQIKAIQLGLISS